MYIDTHTHIYTTEFDEDREAVIERAREAGARLLLLPNIDEASMAQIEALCAAHPDICRPMTGLHPTELPADPWPLLDKMEGLLDRPDHPYIAVGEVGIDLYWDATRRDEQISVLQHQAKWAIKYGLPLMIHSRSAHRELVETLRPWADCLTGVFHCFGGTTEEARELLDVFPGFVLGIGGVLTFKKSTLPATLHATVPLDRIVVETDAPYLAPTPHRGQRNEPSYVPLVIAKLADIYELPVAVIEEKLLENTLRVFPRLQNKAV